MMPALEYPGAQENFQTGGLFRILLRVKRHELKARAVLLIL